MEYVIALGLGCAIFNMVMAARDSNMSAVLGWFVATLLFIGDIV